MERSSLSFWFHQRVKRTGEDSQSSQHCGSLCGSLFSDLTPWGLWGNLTVMGKVGRSLQQTPHRSWPTEFTPCGAQAVILTRGFVHVPNQAGGALWLGNAVGCSSACHGLSNQKFHQLLKRGLPMPRQGAESQPHLLWRVPFSPIRPEGLVAISRSYAAQHTQADSQEGELTASRSKLMAGMVVSCAKHRQED